MTYWEACKLAWTSPEFILCVLMIVWVGLSFWLYAWLEERMLDDRIREIDELRKRLGMDAGDNGEEARK